MKLPAIVLTILLVSFTNILSAQELTSEQASKLMRASGYISTSKVVLKGMMKYWAGLGNIKQANPACTSTNWKI